MNRRTAALSVAIGACCLTAFVPASARAATGDVGYGVTTSGNRLIIFNPQNPAAAGQGTAITGIGSGESIVAIDTRPATSGLYALTDDANGDGRIYLVNTTLASAALLTTTPLALGSAPAADKFDIDFNPCVDRIRVVGSNGVNLRVVPDTGNLAAADTTLAYASGDTNKTGVTPIGGAAYTTATPGTGCTTTLYDADFGADTLDTQGGLNGNPSPNTGTLNTVGSMGTNIQSLLGFDISGSTGTAYLAAQTQNATGVSSTSTQLFSVNLTSGALTPVAANNNVGSDLLATFAVGPSSTPTPALPDFPLPILAAGGALVVGVVALRRRPPRTDRFRRLFWWR